ncbi:hypothetical protein UlMin_025807 [Ulmus minor]
MQIIVQPSSTPYHHHQPPYPIKSSSSSSHSSPSPPSTTTSSPQYLIDPLQTCWFLSNQEFEKLKLLEALRMKELDITIALLPKSFVESMLLPSAYNSLFRFLVKQYLIKRRALMPHALTLVGFFRKWKEDDEEEEKAKQLAGTVEVCFDKRGVNASPPMPIPPKILPPFNMYRKASYDV